ncbi:acyl-CoA dehydrogenase [Enterovirga aerilata]|uniref:Acyl-CoA dehydrogenase n=1 Tax=Enterovirga aerilata TaxID=2730920 RepID=A0A849I9X5_9HYPH|nr:acyl-CoA dehydrogenase [Enterovirga sp. DB1703]NNM72807.1 acyl-CoA dehydrogenase [Enterovirga sp. DB1703]
MDFIDQRELTFLLYDWLGVEELTKAPRFAEHSRETFDAVLETSRKLARELFAPHYKKSDREEPVFQDGSAKVLPEIGEALKAFAEAGLFAGSFDEAHGGLQLPQVIHSAAMSQFFAANIATSAYAMLTTANARLLTTFGTPAQIEAFARPQIEGRWFGTMCLSEPDAGSSLADISTKAVPDGRSSLGMRYRLFGRKMWISGGEHEMTENIVHLVLAKTPGPDGRTLPGTKGISLFAVPKRLVRPDGPLGDRNDIALAGLNHKMGYRGTTNCLLNFGEGERFRPEGKAGAVGYLVGQPGDGLPIMFHMMNEARIAVGLGAAALGCRGYRHALDYARTRRQGRLPGAKDPAAAPVPIIEHADVKRMLLAQKCYAEGALALVLYCAKLVDEQAVAQGERREEVERLLGLLTPVAKSWPSEFCLEANDLAIQVHGGYGYTREFDVEQVYRDNRLNPIHEGTTGIQALDLLGRKILREKGRSFREFLRLVDGTASRAACHADLEDHAAKLRSFWSEIDGTIAVLSELPTGEALDDSWAFLPAFGHGVLAWMLLDQAVLLAGSSRPDIEPSFAAAKLWALRYFYEVELPRARQHLAYVGRRTGLLSGEIPTAVL